MKKIALKGKNGLGKFALVDDDDFKELNKFRWLGIPNRYGEVYAGRSGEKIILMHRDVLNCPQGKEVDHINGDELDNRRSNLRVTNSQQNGWNSKISKINTTGYKGVTWRKRDNLYETRIGFNYKRLIIYCGKDKHIAALMYDFWAIELFGEFAKTNFKVIAHSNSKQQVV